jgi:hypothetical protein
MAFMVSAFELDVMFFRFARSEVAAHSERFLDLKDCAIPGSEPGSWEKIDFEFLAVLEMGEFDEALAH